MVVTGPLEQPGKRSTDAVLQATHQQATMLVSGQGIGWMAYGCVGNVFICIHERNYLAKRAFVDNAHIRPTEKGTDVTSVVVGCLFLTLMRHMHCNKGVVKNDEGL